MSEINTTPASAHYPDLALFIDGQWRSGEGRKAEAVYNPSTGAVLKQLPHASTRDLDDALRAADKAFQTWRDVPATERGALLRRVAALMRQRADIMGECISLEQGKPLAEGKGEIFAAADMIDWCGDEARRLYGRVIPSREAGWRQLVLKQPVGVVAAFTPWNFPTMIPARKIAGSLSAGCTCIIKPSEETPAGVIMMAKIFEEIGLPAGVLNVVFGVPSEVSTHLISSPIVRKVTFTGSVPVGRVIAGLAAKAVKRVTLELGGHAPVLVFDDVDVEKAAKVCAMGKFRNAGQVCTSPTRFFVQRTIHDRFVAAFAKATSAMQTGAAMDSTSNMGPLASSRRVEAMASLVDEAVSQGASLASGGKRMAASGFFFQPTVMHNIPAHARVMHEEPFGPLALVAPFDTEEEAIAHANALPYGLAAYAFTSNGDRMVRLQDKIETGMLGINSFMIAGAESPFGGVKDSGYGSEGGIEGMEAYLVTKYVVQAPSP
jgi:succinate-semialdehyde dehydrogenase/glutarate-semialdehyde dehydrogenase